jgi:hypothetical protein
MNPGQIKTLTGTLVLPELTLSIKKMSLKRSSAIQRSLITNLRTLGGFAPSAELDLKTFIFRYTLNTTGILFFKLGKELVAVEAFSFSQATSNLLSKL